MRSKGSFANGVYEKSEKLLIASQICNALSANECVCDADRQCKMASFWYYKTDATLRTI